MHAKMEEFDTLATSGVDAARQQLRTDLARKLATMVAQYNDGASTGDRIVLDDWDFTLDLALYCLAYSELYFVRLGDVGDAEWLSLCKSAGGWARKEVAAQHALDDACQRLSRTDLPASDRERLEQDKKKREEELWATLDGMVVAVHETLQSYAGH
jgi:hypothetical protein